MNLSGEAVSKIVSFYNIPHQHILVIYDDFEIPFGTIRIKEKGSAGSHNGLKSILKDLKTHDIARIRVGITAPPSKELISHHVLSKFTSSEEDKLAPILKATVDSAIMWANNNTAVAMQQYNKTNLET